MSTAQQTKPSSEELRQTVRIGARKLRMPHQQWWRGGNREIVWQHTESSGPAPVVWAVDQQSAEWILGLIARDWRESTTTFESRLRDGVDPARRQGEKDRLYLNCESGCSGWLWIQEKTPGPPHSWDGRVRRRW